MEYIYEILMDLSEVAVKRLHCEVQWMQLRRPQLNLLPTSTQSLPRINATLFKGFKFTIQMFENQIQNFDSTMIGTGLTFSQFLFQHISNVCVHNKKHVGTVLHLAISLRVPASNTTNAGGRIPDMALLQTAALHGDEMCVTTQLFKCRDCRVLMKWL